MDDASIEPVSQPIFLVPASRCQVRRAASCGEAQCFRRAVAKVCPDVMHAAAAVALLAVLGSVGSAIGRGSTGWALVAQLITIVVMGGFVFLAVQSFKAARLARQAEAA